MMSTGGPQQRRIMINAYNNNMIHHASRMMKRKFVSSPYFTTTSSSSPLLSLSSSFNNDTKLFTNTKFDRLITTTESSRKLIIPPCIATIESSRKLIIPPSSTLLFVSSSSDDTTTTTSTTNTTKESIIGEATAPPVGIDSTTASTTIISNATATHSGPKTLFPWKHESKLALLLPRCNPGSIEYNNDFAYTIRAQSFLSCLFLNMPMYQIFFNTNEWRQNMADTCAYAFTQGIANILLNTYSISKNDIMNNDNNDDSTKIQFNFPPRDVLKPNAENDSSSESVNNNEESKDAVGSDSLSNNTSDDDKTNSVPNSEIKDKTKDENKVNNNDKNIPLDMFSKSLQNLYQSAYTYGKDKYQITLYTEPIQATLYNIHAYPYITRESCENDKGKFVKELIKQCRISPYNAFQLLQEHLEKEYNQHEYLETTIDIQVLIQCNEIFQVIDRDTGNIVQGSTDGIMKSVYHLIRFENNVISTQQETFPYGIISTLKNNWIITNIDDLITTKSWYAKFDI